jgi:hypothetical protein
MNAVDNGLLKNPIQPFRDDPEIIRQFENSYKAYDILSVAIRQNSLTDAEGANHLESVLSRPDIIGPLKDLPFRAPLMEVALVSYNPRAIRALRRAGREVYGTVVYKGKIEETCHFLRQIRNPKFRQHMFEAAFGILPDHTVRTSPSKVRARNLPVKKIAELVLETVRISTAASAVTVETGAAAGFES